MSLRLGNVRKRRRLPALSRHRRMSGNNVGTMLVRCWCAAWVNILKCTKIWKISRVWESIDIIDNYKLTVINYNWQFKIDDNWRYLTINWRFLWLFFSGSAARQIESLGQSRSWKIENPVAPTAKSINSKLDPKPLQNTFRSGTLFFFRNCLQNLEI